jgi:hypothetical protein
MCVRNPSIRFRLNFQRMKAARRCEKELETMECSVQVMARVSGYSLLFG